MMLQYQMTSGILTMISCGEGMKSLERFVSAQSMDFEKILKSCKVSGTERRPLHRVR
jgi:hypothetical protein